MTADVALGLAKLAAVTGRDLQRAARSAGGPDQLWALSPGQLARHLRVTGDSRQEVVAIRRNFDAVAEREHLDALGTTFVAQSAFPQRLREIYDPPFGLFVRSSRGVGQGDEDGRPTVAVVGARRATAMGKEFAHRLSSDLAERGATIVSGLAYGIDAAAHRGAVDGGGLTLAVLGCGVDVPYPARNHALAGEIAGHGALVSEYWPGTKPTPWHFPARNRIVSGLAHATVVVEAGERSGALITADFAAEHGRQVLAVPGAPWSELAAGTNALLRAGAPLCESSEDVIAELPAMDWDPVTREAAATVSDAAAAVLDCLRVEALGVDGIVGRTTYSPARVVQLLGELELAGLAIRAAAGRWSASAR